MRHTCSTAVDQKPSLHVRLRTGSGISDLFGVTTLAGWFKSIFSKGVGVDLGTANTLIFVENHGVVLREPSVIALDHNNTLLAAGEEARAMIGRTPQGVRASRPLRDGVIAELREAAYMLKSFIDRVKAHESLMNPEMVIAVPSGITSVEKIAIKQVADNVKASQVYMPEEPMCAAIGADLPVTEPTGSMIVDIGGGTTEVAVLSLSGIVVNESIRIAGDELNDGIKLYLKKVHSLDVGDKTAEELKFRLGSAWKTQENDKFNVRGLNLINGLPRTITVSRGEIREAMAEPLSAIVAAVKRTLEKTPPELAADIFNRGIVIVGGGAMLQGLDELLASETEVPVIIADDPLSAVAIGTGRMLTDPAYKRVLELSLYRN
ncbi:MAG: rod shape-determining protein [Cyanobacteria bacterium]|nr:rod shape-determining protein [Cyanobacteriota bacterium]